jgi:signal transduction histidine kinase
MRINGFAGLRGWRAGLALAIALVAGLAVNETLFRIAANYQAQVAKVALEGLLERDELLVNPYLLGQAVSDLEMLGLIRCTQMHSSKRPELSEFVNLAQNHFCLHSNNAWLTPLLPVHQKILAGNGDEIDISYQVALGTGFAVGLLGSRFLWIALILAFWSAIRSRIFNQQEMLKLKEAHAEELFSIASQVSHDIRSPVAVLNSIEDQLASLPEESRFMVRAAVQRIRDIANQLLDKNRRHLLNEEGLKHPVTPKKALGALSLGILIDTIVSEKRIQFDGKNLSRQAVQIEFRLEEAYEFFSTISSIEFKRVISNLIDNAIESQKNLNQRANVKISVLEKIPNQIEVRIIDQGKGISPELLSRLGNKGETSGKTEGSGLGLYHARTQVESWSGSLKIESIEGKGTTISFTLPRANPPEWFIEKIEIQFGSKVAILDDDAGIHQILRRKMEELKAEVELFHFHQEKEFRLWHERNTAHLYFVDYELIKEKKKGIETIKNLNIGPRSILVTSRFEQQEIIDACLSLKTRLLPKTLAQFTRIIFSET